MLCKEAYALLAIVFFYLFSILYMCVCVFHVRFLFLSYESVVTATLNAVRRCFMSWNFHKL